MRAAHAQGGSTDEIARTIAKGICAKSVVTLCARYTVVGTAIVRLLPGLLDVTKRDADLVAGLELGVARNCLQDIDIVVVALAD